MLRVIGEESPANRITVGTDTLEMIDAIALWVTSPRPHRRGVLNLPELTLWG
ncbi:hypothetical protein NG799_21780 [Laspinema sp. D1]|uniref:Uncharacterized protein n=1 Tax=Laspinema palackyanum D2a TaxID=2953684 RepID=A0ABT2MW16_9CYAN|nr:hypothetical protein [Laspinema sp. D2a]